MPQQLTFDFVNNGSGKNDGKPEHMLWYENTDAEPEQAIKNASRYYYQKYGSKPVRVALPLKWRGNDDGVIETAALTEALGLDVDTDPLILTKHIAVYS